MTTENPPRRAPERVFQETNTLSAWLNTTCCDLYCQTIKMQRFRSGSVDSRSILAWLADMEAESRALEESNLYALSCEELVRAQRRTLRGLLDHLELAAGGDVVSEMVERSSFRFQSGRPPGQEDPRSFLRKGTIGDWRGRLKPHEKILFKELTSDMLTRLGYEPNDDW